MKENLDKLEKFLKYNVEIKKIYEICFSNMSEVLVDKVGTEIRGGYLFSGIALSEAKSINEILNIIHQTIFNNEENYRNLPVIAQKENDKYYVNYFVPKICNVEMVNNLKCVNKVTEESKYTVGMFETTIEKLPFELVDFITKVPADIHINNQIGIQR